MDASQISSQEMLDQLMADGKITDDEYMRLSRAMQPVSEPQKIAARPPLRKSRKNRLIGGVCAGLAEHFGIDPLIIRVATLVLAIIFPLLSTIVMTLAYVILFFVLPWDSPNETKSKTEFHPWRFAAGSMLFLSVIPYVIAKLTARLAEYFSQLGTQMPPLAIVLVKIGIGHFYWAYLFSFWFIALATSIYMFIRDARQRRIYATVFLWLCFLWSLFLIVAYIATIRALPVTTIMH